MRPLLLPLLGIHVQLCLSFIYHAQSGMFLERQVQRKAYDSPFLCPGSSLRLPPAKGHSFLPRVQDNNLDILTAPPPPALLRSMVDKQKLRMLGVQHDELMIDIRIVK